MARKVRTAEVMRIRAFLKQAGTDNEEASIANLPKYKQLIKLFAKQKKQDKNWLVENGWTIEELALGFNSAQDPPKKGEEWIPTHKSYMSIHATIRRARNFLLAHKGHPNYAILTDLPGLQGLHMVQMPNSENKQLDMAQQRVDNMVKGATKRSEDLEELKRIPPRKRAINQRNAEADAGFNSEGEK